MPEEITLNVEEESALDRAWDSLETDPTEHFAEALAEMFAEHDDDDAQRYALMADILGGLFGDEALTLFDEPEKFWEEAQHPRGKSGKFIEKHSAEARQAAREAIARILKGERTAETHKALVEHLSLLTVAQLHELKKEYGLSASAGLKEQLVSKLADRLGRGRHEQPEKAKEEKNPVQRFRQMLLDTMKPELGDKAEEAAKAIGLNLNSAQIAQALHNRGISIDEAAKMVPGIQAKIIENLEAEGVPIPVGVQKMTVMTKEERDKLDKEEQEKWQRERDEKTARAKEFAAANYKKPPAPEEVDSKTWIAIKLMQERDQLAKDKAKIQAMAARIKTVEASYKTNPNYQEEVEAAYGDAAKPGNKRLLNKYRPDWYEKRKNVRPKDALYLVDHKFDAVEFALRQKSIAGYTDAGVKAVAEHKEAVKKATEDAARDVPDAIVEEYMYEDWVPKKYQERTITRAQLEHHDKYMKEQHAYGNAILKKAMDAAAPQLKPLMDRAAANDAKMTEAISKAQADYDAASTAAADARLARIDFAFPYKVDGTVATYDVPEDKTAEWEALNQESYRRNDERYRLEGVLMDVKKAEGAKFLDGLLPKKGNANIEFQGGAHLDDNGKANLAKAKEFLSRAVSDKWGKMPVSIEKNFTGRASQGFGKIFSDPNEASWVLVHEYGHLIEEQNANTLGTLSRAFAMQAVADAGEKPKHPGGNYESNEVMAKNGFQNPYVGKFYNHNSSEVLSMGVQHLYQDPVNFYKESPKHFEYTLAALHGLLTQ